MASIIKVDTIQHSDGSAPTMADLGLNVQGSVLQVVQGELGTTASGATSGNLFYDSGLQASITPTSTSSKILISYTINLGGYYQHKSRIMRDSTAIGLGTSEGGRPVASSAQITYDAEIYAEYTHQPQGISYLDIPETTSAITYKIQVASYNGTSWYVNRGIIFQNSPANGYDAIPLSTITLIEIAG